MKKVLVIGCPGSGKTTFSNKLAKKGNLPIFYLDSLYYGDSWNLRPIHEWRTYVKNMVKKDKWLMDGNYTSTLDIRIPEADTVILLNYPRRIVVTRILIRGIRRRPDESKDKKGNFSWKLFKFTWQFKKYELPKVLAAIEKYGKAKSVEIFTKPKQAEDFLKS